MYWYLKLYEKTLGTGAFQRLPPGTAESIEVKV